MNIKIAKYFLTRTPMKTRFTKKKDESQTEKYLCHNVPWIHRI